MGGGARGAEGPEGRVGPGAEDDGVRVDALAVGPAGGEGLEVDRKGELGEQWVEVKAETLYRRPGFGFAVKFIDVPDETRARLVRALDVVD